MTDNRLSVRLNEEPLGYLDLVGGSKMRFAYLPSASRPLSLSMPVRDTPYANRACEAFFGGLLPESPHARQELSRLLHVGIKNSFGILEALGYDCAGAVSIRGIDEPVLESALHKLDGTSISTSDLGQLLRELPQRPLLAGTNGMRISLAGAQEKAAVCLLDNEILLPANGSPTTHIIKPRINSSKILDSVANEYFCMTLAKLSGLETPVVEMRAADGIDFLLIQRYDRKWVDSEQILRIHQEDFCQAMGIVPWDKYQIDGGPTLQKSFELLKHTKIPAINRAKLLNLVIFNYLIGNCDAHGKNFSLLHDDDGNTRLAPVYDLMNTSIYPEVDTRLAMSIGGASQADKVYKSNWEKFCKDIGLSFPGFVTIALTLTAATRRNSVHLSKEMKKTGTFKPIIDEITDSIKRHGDFLTRQLNS